MENLEQAPQETKEPSAKSASRGPLSQKSIVVVLLFLVLFGSVAFWMSLKSSKNSPTVQEHSTDLVMNVPYFGIINTYPDYAVPAVTTVETILTYYRDDRFSLNDLMKLFPPGSGQGGNRRGILAFEKFFNGVGYKTEKIVFEGPRVGNEIEEIKKYIKSGTPVIVSQVRDLNSEDVQVTGWRIVIGLNEDTKEIVFHDHTLGNNVVSSFSDFASLFNEPGHMLLAVWPSPELMDRIGGVDRSLAYKDNKLEESKIVELLQKNSVAEILVYRAKQLCNNDVPGDVISDEYTALLKKAIDNWKDVLNSGDSNILPKIMIMKIKVSLADALLRLGNESEVIEYLNNEAIPFNNDLKVLPEGDVVWDLQFNPQAVMKVVGGQMPYVWSILGNAHFILRDYESARDAFNTALEIDPEDTRAKEFLRRLDSSPVEIDNTARIYECMGGYQKVN